MEVHCCDHTGGGHFHTGKYVLLVIFKVLFSTCPYKVCYDLCSILHVQTRNALVKNVEKKGYKVIHRGSFSNGTSPQKAVKDLKVCKHKT